jgi:hypothetical protein
VTKKVSVISRALTQKGFVEDDKRDHKYYFFHFKEKKTQIYTKISHSARDVSSNLLSAMARQVRLTTPEFYQLVDCEMDAATYRESLVDRGHVTP